MFIAEYPIADAPIADFTYPPANASGANKPAVYINGEVKPALLLLDPKPAVVDAVEI